MTQAKGYTVIPEPLTAEAFRQFGDVIEVKGKQSPYLLINEGNTCRYHNLASLDLDESGGRPIVSIFRGKPLAFPWRVRFMERHPISSQAFIPLSNNPLLVLVAPAGTTPSIENIRFFISNGHQGINYHRNVWHHYLLTSGEQSDCLVIDRAGDGSNCEEYYFPDSLDIFLEVPHLIR